MSTLNRSYYHEPLKDDEAEHEKRCVFNRLLKEEEASYYLGHDSQQQQQEQHLFPVEQADPRKQYVAVQHGQDIPLKGLRKPAPQPNVYKGKRVCPAPFR